MLVLLYNKRTMKNIRETTPIYIFSNFLKLVLLAILPAVALGFTSVDHSNVTLFLRYLSNPNFVLRDYLYIEVLNYFSFFNFSERWWLFLIASALACVSLSFILANVQRHMRLGVDNFSGTYKFGIRLLPSCALFVVIAVLSHQIFTLIATGLAYLVSFLVVDSVINLTITVVLQIVAKLAYVMLASLFLCTLPAIQCEGFRLNMAANYSIKIVSKYYYKVAFTLTYVYLFTTVVYYVLPIYLDGLKEVISSLYFLMWIIYLPTYAERIYALFEDVERKDLKKNIWRSR